MRPAYAEDKIAKSVVSNCFTVHVSHRIFWLYDASVNLGDPEKYISYKIFEWNVYFINSYDSDGYKFYWFHLKDNGEPYIFLEKILSWNTILKQVLSQASTQHLGEISSHVLLFSTIIFLAPERCPCLVSSAVALNCLWTIFKQPNCCKSPIWWLWSGQFYVILSLVFTRFHFLIYL